MYGHCGLVVSDYCAVPGMLTTATDKLKPKPCGDSQKNVRVFHYGLAVHI